MENTKYKIAILSDLKDSTSVMLKSTVSLAKMIDGSIEFFHVKKPMDVVDIENQLSAIRGINEKYLDTEREIEKMTAPIVKEYGIDISYKYAFGNVKTEINAYIKEGQPDIIVLGKRKPKLLNFLGDSITEFVLKTYDGVVMIATDTNALEPDMEFCLGVLNGREQTSNIAFGEALMGHSQPPLRSFKILKNKNTSLETSVSNEEIIEYVFDHGDSGINNLSKYLTICKVNLLYVERTDHTIPNLMESDIQNIMDDLNVSLIIGNSKRPDNNAF